MLIPVPEKIKKLLSYEQQRFENLAELREKILNKGGFIFEKEQGYLCYKWKNKGKIRRKLVKFLGFGRRIYTTTFHITYWNKVHNVENIAPAELKFYPNDRKIKAPSSDKDDPNCHAFTAQYTCICECADKTKYVSHKKYEELTGLLTKHGYRKYSTTKRTYLKPDDIVVFEPYKKSDSGHSAVVFARDKRNIWCIERKETGGNLTIRTFKKLKGSNLRRNWSVYRK